MMDGKLAKEVLNVLKATEAKPKAYDTTAEVRRVDGDTLWVHIPGGVDETPVSKTINASPGDTIQVRVSGGRAFAVGNATAPPTDDKAANAVLDKLNANWAKIDTAIINTLEANGINADWIKAGALVIYDDDGNEIFRADKTGKIFRWNSENSQMDADGTIALKSFYDDQQGSGSASAPAFTSTKDVVTHNSIGTYAVTLKRVIIQYGEKIIMNTTWYDFSTEADYELFAEDGDESHAANISASIVTYSSAYIQVKDGSNNYFLDFNFGAGGGSLELNGRLIEPFWAYYNEITSGTNMNSYQTPGTYRCGSSGVASSVTNAPFSEPFQCCVYESGAAPSGTTGSIMQIAWNFSSSTSIKYRMYVTNTGWSAWYGIQKEGVAYKTGTVTIASGTQSTATQTINFSDVVPTGKSVYGVVLTLGSYQMPYVNSSGNVVTWISNLTNSEVTISNKTSAWTNYNYYITVFYH